VEIEIDRKSDDISNIGKDDWKKRIKNPKTIGASSLKHEPKNDRVQQQAKIGRILTLTSSANLLLTCSP